MRPAATAATTASGSPLDTLEKLPWGVLALGLGFLAGVAVDAIGAGQRTINLLAPPVWGVVAWNLAVYAFIALGLLWNERPLPWPARLLGWRLPPLNAHEQRRWGLRIARALHLGAAALAVGMVAGLYLRGMVLAYRAGWESTFLDTPQVARLLGTLLAPASWATGYGVPEGPALALARSQPQDAAVWIHLYAATLALFVVLPRLLLALGSSIGLAWASRPGAQPQPRQGPPALGLLGHGSQDAHELARAFELQPAPGGWALWRDASGRAPCLRPAPGPLAALPPAPQDGWGLRLRTWWQGLRPGRHDAAGGWNSWQAWAGDCDLLLVALPPGQELAGPQQQALAALGRPWRRLGLNDAAAEQPLNTALGGWPALAGGLLAAAPALPPPAREELASAVQAWAAAQRQTFDAAAARLQAVVDEAAHWREPLADAGGGLRERLGGKLGQWLRLPAPEAGGVAPGADPAEAAKTQAQTQAQAALAARLAQAVQAATAELLALHGRPAGEAALQVDERIGQLTTEQARLDEKRAALWGGLVSGALAGLKADLATGGLTLGAGALAGGLIGALGGAGLARGVNLARDQPERALVFNEEALAELRRGLLLRWLWVLHPQAEAAQQAAWPALVAEVLPPGTPLRAGAVAALQRLHPAAAALLPK